MTAVASAPAERFARPDPWHMPAAYWFWHRLPTETEIADQVADMAAAGLRSFQIQTRLSFPREEYLSPRYLELCRRAVEAAARAGMLVGIYDDYNWQSGHAAGRAVDGHGHLRERMLMWTRSSPDSGGGHLVVSGIDTSARSLGAPGMEWHYDGAHPRWGDWRAEFVIARRGDRLLDVTRQAEVRGTPDGCQVHVETDAHEVVAFVSARCETSRMVNLMDPAAVARFVEAGYQPYADALGEHLGSTVRYLFFDQPHTNFYTWRELSGDLRSAVPWADDLADLVRERWPSDHLAVLLALLDDDVLGEPSWARRASFYEFYSGLSIERFLGTARAWTSARGIALSGHEVLAHVGGWDLDHSFGDWDLRVNFGLDYFGVDAMRDLTGVDAQDSRAQLSAKLGDSAARSHGRSGVILEQYYGDAVAGAGTYTGHWGLTLAEMRAQAIRHHLLGMRQFLFHGYYLTDGTADNSEMFANPRFDFPPGINYEPWFAPFHAAFAEESGRLSTFLDDAEPACDVAVLYPLRTIWAHGLSGPHARHVGRWCRVLAEGGYGFHLVDERDLVDTCTEPGALVLGSRRYGTLVVPSVRVVQSLRTLTVLERLARAGVRVVFTGDTPDTCQDTGGSAAPGFAALRDEGVITHLADVPAPAEARTLIGPPGATQAGCPSVVVGRRAAQVWTWRGRDADGGWRIALFNDGAIARDVAIAPEAPTSWERWDARSGHVHDAGTDLAREVMSLDPGELRLLRLGGKPTAGAHPRQARERRPIGEWEDLHDGWTWTSPSSSQARPIEVDRGWQLQPALARYAGEGRYHRTLRLPEGADLELDLPAVAGSVIVEVDGAEIARLGWPPFRAVIPATGDRRIHELTVRVFSPAANHYYADTGMRDEPEPAGLLAPPRQRLIRKEETC